MSATTTIAGSLQTAPRSAVHLRVGVIAAIACLAFGFMARPARAIGNFPFVVQNHLQAEQLAFQQRINGSVDAPRGAGFNQKIAEAREAYWKAYASGEIPQDVENRFANLLAEKDVTMMLTILSDEATNDALEQFGVGDPRTEELVHGLWARMREGVDGGLRPGARAEFFEWVTVVKRRMDADPALNPLTIMPVALQAIGASLDAADPQVRAYVEARNRAEMSAVLDQLPFDGDRDYLLTRLELKAYDQRDAIAPWYDQLEQVAGKQRMDEIAAAIRQASKDSNGDLEGPVFTDRNGEELWLSAQDRIERLVGNSSPRLYVLWQIRRSRNVSWPEAERIYQTYWVEPFGEQKVLEAAENVRTAEKTISRLGREILLNPIAGDSSPEWALAKSMPYLPYRDMPLGSLDSTDPQRFLYALLKEYGTVQYWNEVPAAYEELADKWGAQALLDAAGTVMSASRNASGQLAAPAEIGVRTAEPWNAFLEVLNQKLDGPDGYFVSLARDAGWKWRRAGSEEFRASSALKEYENLTDAFGPEKVAAVIARVRETVENNVDLSTLDGAVSGSKKPLPTIYEVLWSDATPEQYLDYLGRLGSLKEYYYKDYGREITLTAVEKIIKAKKQLKSLDALNVNLGNVLLVDRESVGLPPSDEEDKYALGAVSCLADLIRQEQARRRQGQVSSRAAPEAAAPPSRSGNPETSLGSGARIREREQEESQEPERTQVAATSFQVGQQLERRSGGSDAITIIRVFEGDDDVHYLIADSKDGRHCVWRTKDQLSGWSIAENQPDPSAPGPNPQVNRRAADANPWSEGSKVRVSVLGQLRDGVVVFFEGRSQPPTWAVRYEPADKTGGARGLRLFPKSSIRFPAPDPDAFPVGSHVRLIKRGQEMTGTVTGFHPERGWTVHVKVSESVERDTLITPRSLGNYRMTLIDPANAQVNQPAGK